MTKKVLIIMAAVVMIALPSAAQDNAYGFGNGNRNGSGNANGNGNGNGPMHNILEGTPFTYSGTIVSIGNRGEGMVITTDQGNVTVHGLGPYRYWKSLEVDKPDLGETIAAYGYTVDFNDNIRNILTKVEFNGTTVELRDSETGAPLWRGNGNRRGHGRHGHHRNGFRWDILNGTPFSFAGDVITVGVSQYGTRGNGMTIATNNTNITVNGLGPQRYWDSIGVTRPMVGDYVETTGYTVDYKGNLVNILMTVTIGGQAVQLRDPETGLPLWRGNRGNR